MTHQTFDLIVIGAGSGGLAAAETAAQQGQRVALIEAHELGGTCVNNGCVPKKVMWYAAHLAHAVDDASEFGIPAQRGTTDWQRLVQGRDQYIQTIREYWSGYINNNGIEHIRGFGRFIDAHTVEANGQHYRAEHIVIATGGQALVPPVPGAELGITSEGFFELQALPKKVAVIGGGYIGVELSGVLKALGSEVTLFALEDRVLERFDAMVSRVMEQEMRQQGIEMQTGFNVNALQQAAKGLRVMSADGAHPDHFDSVIWAVGRRANTAALNLQAAGVTQQANGMIPVDAFENTNVPGIYAIGDITGRTPLTPVAIAAGRQLARRLFNGEAQACVDYHNIPSAVFSHPPIGTIGMSEQQAREQFDSISVYETEFVPMRYALNRNGSTTAMKLVCAGERQRVVGIHIIGDHADEMLQGFAVAVKMGATKADFDRTIALHPTSAEELVTLKTPVQRDSYSQTVEWKKAG